MKALEDMLMRALGNRVSGIADRQNNRAILFLRADPNSSTGAVIFPRVFQQVLHDQAGISMLARDDQIRRQVRLNLYFHFVRQRAEVVEPFLHELGSG